eukprot:8531199-Lingulodinium_polyedra.AAC.1
MPGRRQLIREGYGIETSKSPDKGLQEPRGGGARRRSDAAMPSGIISTMHVRRGVQTSKIQTSSQN